MKKRRALLKSLGAMATVAASGLPASAIFAAAPQSAAAPRGSVPQVTAEKPLNAPQRFDYAWLKGRARALSGQAHRGGEFRLPEAVAKLDWDRYQAIRYRDNHVLWARDGLNFRVAFFHLGLYYQSPVRVHELVNGVAQELAYNPDMFDYGKSGLAGANLPADLGFAGFRVNFRTDWKRDVAAFLGASYFRAVGGEWQYGLSARGLAIDCGMDRPEEFPQFTEYWIERPAKGAETLVVYALMESPSITGAYRIALRPAARADANMVMEVDAALYPRKAIERMGVAPLTSMYQHGENDRRAASDWRPEIHDSDGLAMQAGTGEWLWRPLQNPLQLGFNAYADESPRGFGLLQRDRNFDHYQDDGVFYEKRPSLWVQPKGSWGKGSVQLVEIPTPDETLDNIVAFWNPEQKPQPGQELLFGYYLHWGAKMPAESPLARTVATRTGVGGVVGQKRSYYSRRFVVDFAGGQLAKLQDAKSAKGIEAVISASRGEIEITSARPLAEANGYRAMFDLKPTDSSTAPIALRLYLRRGKEALTETWMYQWSPPPVDERRF